MKSKIAGALMVGVFAAAFAQSPYEFAQEMTTQEKFTQGDKTLLYRQYLPKGAHENLPLVIFFHGAGERGADNTRQLVHGVGQFIKYSIDNKKPFILIAAQCPSNAQWVDTPWGNTSHRIGKCSANMALAIGLLEERIATLKADRRRIYVSGISMGGYGTWDILVRRPDLFAAAIPICGGGDAYKAYTIRNIPIWVFHGSADTAVPTVRSRQMVSALWQCEGNVRYTEYPGMGHGSWGPTYSNKAVFDWLFSQRK